MKGAPMKINKLLESVGHLKPNTVDVADIFDWIDEIEGIVYKGVFEKAEDTTFESPSYDYETDQDKDLLVPAPFDIIYFHYLSAKIDFTEGEINSYNNNMSLYNTAYDDFAAYYRRNHMPKRGY
jgi:hypothetical protein